MPGHASSQWCFDPFREHLPDLNTPHFQNMKDQDAHEYARTFFEQQRPSWLYALIRKWKELYAEPYHGITTDRKGIYLTP